jgi:hypothetical protein
VQPTPTPEPLRRPTPTPGLPSALSILEAAFEASRAADSYHFELAVEVTLPEGGAEPTTYNFAGTGDFKAPDRLRISRTMDLQGRVVQSETITIGARTYPIGAPVQDDAPGLDVAKLFQEPQNFILAEPSQVEDLVLVGEESLGEEQVYRLTGAARGAPPRQEFGESTVEFLVGVADKLLKRIILDGKVSLTGAPADSADAVTVLATINYTDYGEAIATPTPELMTFITSRPGDIGKRLVIARNTTWTAAQSPYILAADVVVNADVRLRIEAGTEVRVGGVGQFHPLRLEVRGALIAEGTKEQPVVFTSNRMGGDLERRPGDWNGILLTGEGGGLVDISFAQVSYADFGLAFVGFQGVATVTSSSFTRNKLAGVYIRDSARVTLIDSTMTGNAIGIAMDGLNRGETLVNVTIRGSTISGNVIGIAVNTHAGCVNEAGEDVGLACVEGTAEDARVCLGDCPPWAPRYQVPVGGGISDLSIEENRISNNAIGIEFNALCVRCVEARFGNVSIADNLIVRNQTRGLFLGFGEVRRSQYSGYGPLEIRSNAISANGIAPDGVSASGAGITLFRLADGAPISIIANSIGYNGTGIEFIGVESDTLSIRLNDIYESILAGARIIAADEVRSPDPVFHPTRVNMVENYWNAASGPQHDFLNPRASGDRVSARPSEVAFIPFQAEPNGVLNARPVAAISPVPVARLDEEVVLNASSSTDDGEVAEYFFNFDGRTGSGWLTSPTVSAVYPRPGLYLVQVWVSDRLGVESAEPAEVIIIVEQFEAEDLESPTPEGSPGPGG